MRRLLSVFVGIAWVATGYAGDPPVSFLRDKTTAQVVLDHEPMVLVSPSHDLMNRLKFKKGLTIHMKSTDQVYAGVDSLYFDLPDNMRLACHAKVNKQRIAADTSAQATMSIELGNTAEFKILSVESDFNNEVNMVLAAPSIIERITCNKDTDKTKVKNPKASFTVKVSDMLNVFEVGGNGILYKLNRKFSVQ